MYFYIGIYTQDINQNQILFVYRSIVLSLYIWCCIHTCMNVRAMCIYTYPYIHIHIHTYLTIYLPRSLYLHAHFPHKNPSVWVLFLLLWAIRVCPLTEDLFLKRGWRREAEVYKWCSSKIKLRRCSFFSFFLEGGWEFALAIPYCIWNRYIKFQWLCRFMFGADFMWMCVYMIKVKGYG